MQSGEKMLVLKRKFRDFTPSKSDIQPTVRDTTPKNRPKAKKAKLAEQFEKAQSEEADVVETTTKRPDPPESDDVGENSEEPSLLSDVMGAIGGLSSLPKDTVQEAEEEPEAVADVASPVDEVEPVFLDTEDGAAQGKFEHLPMVEEDLAVEEPARVVFPEVQDIMESGVHPTEDAATPLPEVFSHTEPEGAAVSSSALDDQPRLKPQTETDASPMAESASDQSLQSSPEAEVSAADSISPEASAPPVMQTPAQSVKVAVFVPIYLCESEKYVLK